MSGKRLRQWRRGQKRKRQQQGYGMTAAEKYARKEREKAKSAIDIDCAPDIEKGSPAKKQILQQDEPPSISNMASGPPIASVQHLVAKPLHQESSGCHSKTLQEKAHVSSGQSKPKAPIAGFGKSPVHNIDLTAKEKDTTSRRENKTSSNVSYANPVDHPEVVTGTASTKCGKFDSYLAWIRETNPTLKNIRYLGHMYTTLPFAELDASILLQFLSNASGIPLDIFPARPPSESCCIHTFNIVMDRKILLACSSSEQEQDAVELACKEVLKNVSKPYLCLKSNILFGSEQQFLRLPPEKCESEGIIYDSEEVNQNPDKQENGHPPRVPHFFLISSPQRPFYATLVQSVRAQQKLLKIATVYEQRKAMRVIRLDGQEIGRTKALGKKKSRALASEMSFRNLRACHWLLYELKKSLCPKRLLIKNLKRYLPTEYKLADSIGSDDLSCSGLDSTGGEGISKSCLTDAVPCAGEKPCKNADELELHKSFQVPTKNLHAAKVPLAAILQAFADSPFIFNPLFLPCVDEKEMSSNIYKLAKNLDLNLIVKGQHSKRIIVQKKCSSAALFYSVVKAGGTTGVYKLIPLQRMPSNQLTVGKNGKTGIRPVDYVGEIDTSLPADRALNGKEVGDFVWEDGCLRPVVQKGLKIISRGVQCSLIPAPLLLKFEDGTHVEIIRGENEGNQEPPEELEVQEEEEFDFDEMEDSLFGSDEEQEDSPEDE